MADEPYLIAYRRNLEGRGFLILCNASGTLGELEPGLTAGRLVLGNYPDAQSDGSGMLRPWEARILEDYLAGYN